jgi:hypothetical protein
MQALLPMSNLTNFEKIEVQMQYVIPLIQDLKEILGEEVIIAALEERNKRRDALPAAPKKPDFSRMMEGTKVFAAGGVLDYEVIASSDQQFDMDVHHCRYAEMVSELGGRDFGHLLICANDFAAAKKIGMKLTRTQTYMQGAAYCDFRYRPDDDQEPVLG